MDNEWGIKAPVKRQQGLGDATTTASTPMSPGATGAIGAGLGAVAGAVGERVLMKGTGVMGGALGAVAGGAAGYFYGKSNQPAAASGSSSSSGGTSNAKTIPLVLSPGAMSNVGLSLTGDNAFTLSLPQGASGVVTALSADATTVAITTMLNGGTVVTTGTALKVGSTSIAVAWTDANGQNQQSTFNVTVSA